MCVFGFCFFLTGGEGEVGTHPSVGKKEDVGPWEMCFPVGSPGVWKARVMGWTYLAFGDWQWKPSGSLSVTEPGRGQSSDSQSVV